MSPADAALGSCSLEGMRVLVTGASSGIGAACALECARRGARIIAHGRDSARLSSTLHSLPAEGHAAEPFDLRDIDSIPGWIEDVASRHGPLDSVIHSAGTSLTMPLRGTTPRMLMDVMQVNFHAAYFLVQGFRRREVSRRPGSVVLLGSVASESGQPGLSAYSASKGALVSLARSLASELAPESIRVNVVAPGLVMTEMVRRGSDGMPDDSLQRLASRYPLGLGATDDVAAAAAFLVSPGARWITGTTLTVDGGRTA